MSKESIGIKHFDLAKIEQGLTPLLNGIISSHNLYRHEGTLKKPTFMVVRLYRRELTIDTVVAIAPDCNPGLAHRVMK